MNDLNQAQRAELQRGLTAMELSYTDEQVELWLQFLVLLHKWNRVYNLSAVRDPMQMVSRHLLDSLSVLPYLKPGRCIDVGAGAGLPGIPLAIARPDLSYCLLDSNSKKTRFMQQAVLELGLRHVEVVQNRVEAYRPEAKFDNVIARAFTALPDLQAMTRHLVVSGGQLMAMTAREDVSQPDQDESGFRHVSTHHLQVPGTDAQRRLKLFEAV